MNLEDLRINFGMLRFHDEQQAGKRHKTINGIHFIASIWDIENIVLEGLYSEYVFLFQIFDHYFYGFPGTGKKLKAALIEKEIIYLPMQEGG
jgi:hypothetical protein